eukprot:m.620269 g.620269  ORF g.620269 m.620269 type:complete len:510 (-) comp22534_c0_seq3:540-2069(-)
MEEPESIQGGSTDIDSTECSNECAVTASISEDASYVEANASSENDNASITAADDSGNGSPDSIPKEILVLETVKSLTSLSVTDVDSDASFEDTLKTTLARRNGWKPRSELPVKRKIDPKEASVWSILKKNIGKNLSKISMPIALNEPLSALQRLCEELEHCHLLDKAADEKCPSKQLLYVAAFAVSGYAATYFRGGRKPFNPLLGETYDYVCPEKKFRFVAEQVSHHPPMSAGYATSPKWEVSQESGGETKFRATCLRILPQGRIRVKLLPSGSTFEWCKVTTSVEDIFSGNRWVDHYGTMIVTNNSNRDHAVVSFTQNGVFKKESRRNVEAQVFSTAQGMDSPAVYTFKGKWNEMLVCPELNNEVLFKAVPYCCACMSPVYTCPKSKLHSLTTQDVRQHLRRCWHRVEGIRLLLYLHIILHREGFISIRSALLHLKLSIGLGWIVHERICTCLITYTACLLLGGALLLNPCATPSAADCFATTRRVAVWILRVHVFPQRHPSRGVQRT